MHQVLDPFRFMLIAVARWMNQQQQFAIDHWRQENRVLREQLGDRRLRLNDDKRRSLAAKARRLSRRVLKGVAGDRYAGNALIVAPQADRAEIRWYGTPWPGAAAH
jgi:hypothetical protein